jgi:hypothetical protein
VDVGAGSACPTCGSEVTDLTIQSQPVLVPASAAAQPASAAAQPASAISEIRRIAAWVIVAAAGGGLVAVASFLPWFGYARITKTGWDIFDVQSKVGNPFLVEHMFSSAFNPVFTGLTTLILGILAVVVAGIILVSPRPALPGKYSVPLVVVALATILGLAVFMVAFVNVGAYVVGNPRGYSLEIGLILLVIGGVLAMLGLVGAMQRPSSMWRGR